MASTSAAATSQVQTGQSTRVSEKANAERPKQVQRWGRLFRRGHVAPVPTNPSTSNGEDVEMKRRLEKWSMGVLNDKETEEVPGSVLLMSNTNRNEPLGLRNAPARTSASSLPSPFPPGTRSSSARPSMSRRRSDRSVEEKKRTPDGKIILEPQPEESMNDPLNWPTWRRDVALMSLGFYCMVGGGMTPVLAAGFDDVAHTYGVSIHEVALTTGLYMLGLGLGSVIFSPTAILFGKRPVYLGGIILFIISCIWCALSPNYASLAVARIFQGLAVSPCECLPSATIAEIFYLHQRAYRLGIYTLLLLSGKNLVPLVSAAIIEGLNWQWVFWIIAMVVAFCFVLMLLFVPETFWDRTPQPHKSRKQTLASISAIFHHPHERKSAGDLGADGSADMRKLAIGNSANASNHISNTIAERRRQKHAHHHVGFADKDEMDNQGETNEKVAAGEERALRISNNDDDSKAAIQQGIAIPPTSNLASSRSSSPASHRLSDRVIPRGEGPQTPGLHSFNSPFYSTNEKSDTDYVRNEHEQSTHASNEPETLQSNRTEPFTTVDSEKSPAPSISPGLQRYTTYLRTQPPKTYAQTLKPWNGRLRHDSWGLVMLRPFILFAYPAILWSTLVYSLSIGWLIVLSEALSEVYKGADNYNFNALQTGLVYLSPFIGGIIGTAVAGKFSDIIVRFMSRRNGGVYEPEFRLVMAIPITISTCIGLMGFGWSAEERNNWIVPTVFFGVISFGCSLGSTTAITFAVDSYRQYAGEALVTLNFSKNVFHGLVFSLFFNHWLEHEGKKDTFVAIGGIQLACMLTTIPMYIYGKRARMWTVRKKLMEKF